MNITKTTCVSGVLCHYNGQEVALIAAAGHGAVNVMPNAKLVQHIGATSRCCLGMKAAELFVQVLAAEWELYSRAH